MDAVKQEIQIFFKAFIQAYMCERNLEKTMPFFAKEGIFSIGASAVDAAHSYDELYEQMKEGLASDPVPFVIEWQELLIQPVGTEGFYQILAFFNFGKTVHEKTFNLSARCTALVGKESGKWKLHSLHLSTPLRTAEIAEFYPIRFAEERINSLDIDVRHALISVLGNSGAGLMGAYREEDFPLYFVNDRMLETLGYDTQEEFSQAVGGKVVNAIHPDDRRHIMDTANSSLLSKIPYEIEFRMKKKDGTYIWIWAQGKSVYVKGRTVVVAACMDTTNQVDLKHKLVKTTRDLQEVSNDLKDITDNLPVGICAIRLDENMTMLYGSEGFFKICGYTPQEFKEKFNNELIHILPPDKREENRESVNRAYVRKNSSYEFEKQALRADGTIVWVLMKGYIRALGDGSRIAQCVIMDISERKRIEEELKINEERFRIALEQTDNVVYDYNPNTHVITHLTKYIDQFRFDETTERVPDCTIEKGLIHPDYEMVFRKMYDLIHQGEKYASCTVKARRAPETEFRWVRFKLTNIFGIGGSVVKTIGVIEDVTDQKEIELAYMQEEQFRNAMLTDALVYIEADLDKDIILKCTSNLLPDVKDYERKPYSYYVQQIAENEVFAEDSEQYTEVFSRDALLAAYHEGKREVRCECRRMSGEEQKWMLTTGHMVQDMETGGVRLMAYVRDIDQHKRKTLALQYESEHDALTGLYNKKSAQDRIKEYIDVCSDTECYIMMIMDIDHFKEVNDTYGHLYGDKVLAAFGNLLSSQFRADDIVGRLGGDEFIVLMRNTGSQWLAARKAQGICDMFHNAFKDKGLSSSIGILVTGGQQPFEKLYRRADIALYQAKKSGRNRYVFYRDNQDSLDTVSEMYQMLLERIENNTYEVCAVPWRHVKTNQFMGVSMFLRDTGTQKLMTEGNIDALLSSSEVRPLLTRYLFEQGCRFISEHSQNAPTQLVVSVELSWENLREPNLVSDLCAIRRDYNVDSRRIQFDIPEEVCEKERESLDEVCAALVKEGFKLGLSCFGSKYASLSFVQAYPFDCVKIDRSVVQNWDSTEKSRRAMAESILDMCCRMGIVMAVEGVDTEQQRALLEEYGYEYFSGAAAGEPVSIEDSKNLR